MYPSCPPPPHPRTTSPSSPSHLLSPLVSPAPPQSHAARSAHRAVSLQLAAIAHIYTLGKHGAPAFARLYSLDTHPTCLDRASPSSLYAMANRVKQIADHLSGTMSGTVNAGTPLCLSLTNEASYIVTEKWDNVPLAPPDRFASPSPRLFFALTSRVCAASSS